MTEVKASMGWITSVQVTVPLKWGKSPQKPLLYQHKGRAEKYTPANTHVRPVLIEGYQCSQKP